MEAKQVPICLRNLLGISEDHELAKLLAKHIVDSTNKTLLDHYCSQQDRIPETMEILLKQRMPWLADDRNRGDVNYTPIFPMVVVELCNLLE